MNDAMANDHPQPSPSETAALEVLYAEHGRALLAYAQRFTADRGRAEDLVQETFVRAWRHLPELLEDGRPIRAWLMQVIRRLSIDADRARRARPLLLEATPTIEPAVGDGMDHLMDQAVLRQALARLSADQRQLVVDTYLLDIPLHVTAQRLGVPSGTARSRLHHALSRMRHQLSTGFIAA